MKIYARVTDVNGIYASVVFTNGVGETDNPRLIEWFKNHGYSLEKCDISNEIPHEKCDFSEEILNEVSETTDFDSMTPNQLREWMKANGYGSQIKNIRDKEKLLNIIRG